MTQLSKELALAKEGAASVQSQLAAKISDTEAKLSLQTDENSKLKSDLEGMNSQVKTKDGQISDLTAEVERLKQDAETVRQQMN